MLKNVMDETHFFVSYIVQSINSFKKLLEKKIDSLN